MRTYITARGFNSSEALLPPHASSSRGALKSRRMGVGSSPRRAESSWIVAMTCGLSNSTQKINSLPLTSNQTQGIASTKRQPSSVRPPITGQFLCASGCLAHMGGSRPQFAVGGAAAALVDVQQQQQAGAFGLRLSTMGRLLHSENGWGDTRQRSLL
ncbi:unnamed protein product [Arctogadus glacialis]